MPPTKPAPASDSAEKTIVVDAAPPKEVVVKKAETYTNWRAFAQSKVVPIRVDCQMYDIPGVPRQDSSCHSRLLPSADTFKNHMAAEHGGYFQFFLRKSDGKASPLWEELMTSGLEASDFRCEICDEKLRFHPASIERHLRAHKGKSKRAYDVLRGREPDAQGLLNVALGFRRPEQQLEDLDEVA